MYPHTQQNNQLDVVMQQTLDQRLRMYAQAGKVNHDGYQKILSMFPHHAGSISAAIRQYADASNGTVAQSVIIQFIDNFIFQAITHLNQQAQQMMGGGYNMGMSGGMGMGNMGMGGMSSGMGMGGGFNRPMVQPQMQMDPNLGIGAKPAPIVPQPEEIMRGKKVRHCYTHTDTNMAFNVLRNHEDKHPDCSKYKIVTKGFVADIAVANPELDFYTVVERLHRDFPYFLGNENPMYIQWEKMEFLDISYHEFLPIYKELNKKCLAGITIQEITKFVLKQNLKVGKVLTKLICGRFNHYLRRYLVSQLGNSLSISDFSDVDELLGYTDTEFPIDVAANSNRFMTKALNDLFVRSRGPLGPNDNAAYQDAGVSLVGHPFNERTNVSTLKPDMVQDYTDTLCAKTLMCTYNFDILYTGSRFAEILKEFKKGKKVIECPDPSLCANVERKHSAYKDNTPGSIYYLFGEDLTEDSFIQVGIGRYLNNTPCLTLDIDDLE